MLYTIFYSAVAFNGLHIANFVYQIDSIVPSASFVAMLRLVFIYAPKRLLLNTFSHSIFFYFVQHTLRFAKSSARCSLLCQFLASMASLEKYANCRNMQTIYVCYRWAYCGKSSETDMSQGCCCCSFDLFHIGM